MRTATLALVVATTLASATSMTTTASLAQEIHRDFVADAGTGWDMPFGEGGLVVGYIHDLVEHDGLLVAGGKFKLRGQVENHAIVWWDGEGWQLPEPDLIDGVMALEIYRGDLIAGGRFTHAGEGEIAHIARWDGSAWHPLGGGLDGPVATLAAHGDTLLAGGAFTTADGEFVGRLARWDGERWHSLGDDYVTRIGDIPAQTLTANPITAVTMWRGMIVASDGSFVYSWRDGELHEQQFDAKTQVWAFAEFGDRLVIGGAWSRVSGAHAPGLVEWVGPDRPLRRFPHGIDYKSNIRRQPMVRDMVVYKDRLIVTGIFTRAANREALYIASWNGTQWSALGRGLNQNGNALIVHDGDLIVGGEFSQAGGNAASLIARWRGF